MRGTNHTRDGERGTPSGWRFGGDERGVSEVLGFALTLAIVLTSIAIVFGFGVTALEDVQRSQQAENAEGAFRHVANKFGELGTGGAPYRAGEFSVAPGRVGVQDEVELNVTVVTPSGNHSRVFALGSLAYTRGETSVAFEGGGVFRRDRGGSVALSAPAFDCRPDRALVPVTTLNATTNTSRSADVVTVSGRHDGTTLWYPFDRAGNAAADTATAVTVDVSSPNEAAWHRALSRADGWTDADGDGTFTCTADRVYVRHVRIDVSLV